MINIEPDNISFFPKYIKIFVNGRWIGSHKEPSQLVNKLRNYKRRGLIDAEVSIVYDIYNLELKISTESGRLIRPLLIVENNSTLLTKEHINGLIDGSIKWRTLMTEGVMEYMFASLSDVSK